MNHRKIFAAVADDLRKRYDTKIRFKNESLLMKCISKVLFFNRAFMTDYVTTIGNTIYFPTRADVDCEDPPWGTLAHEGIHVADDYNHPIRFRLSYLFPQIVSVLALFTFGVFWSPWCWFFLLALFALLPLPSPGRARAERRAYIMTAACDAIEYGNDYVNSELYRKSLLSIYTGPAYYFMTHGEESALELVDNDIDYALGLLNGAEDVDYSPTIRMIIYATRESV